jgi:hypothetical protein
VPFTSNDVPSNDSFTTTTEPTYALYPDKIASNDSWNTTAYIDIEGIKIYRSNIALKLKVEFNPAILNKFIAGGPTSVGTGGNTKELPILSSFTSSPWEASAYTKADDIPQLKLSDIPVSTGRWHPIN